MLSNGRSGLARRARHWRRRAAAKLDTDGRHFRVKVERMHPALSRDARGFDAPKRHVQLAVQPRVDPDRARVKLRRDRVRPADVLAPHGGGEAIARGERPAMKRAAKAPKVAAAPPVVVPEVSSGPSSATRAAPSVAEARRLHQQEQAIGDGEAMVWFERGKTAEAEGNAKTAKIYYRMAARRAGGDLRRRIEARLAGIER